MEFRLTFFFCLLIVLTVSANPSENNKERSKRDVGDSIKQTGKDASQALSDAGDSVVAAFTPTEKSTWDKVKDGVKNIGQ
ncbi:hypothetical protein evm_011586 [Chilo suppressalis]|nr:hypothetical protein evm_011586 [Chilo suppressalis]